MTPMSELAKCRCGAEARLSPPWSGRIRAVCVNDECDIRGPRALSEVEAIAAWNALMRPRPVAEWRVTGFMEHLGIGKAVLLSLLRDRGAFYCWSYIADTCGPAFTNEQEAREWGADHLRGLGFDVKEVSGG